MMRFWRDRSIRFRPDRRRPDDWADAHDRARSLAAERLSEPLGPADAAWLVEHLAGCPTCQGVATAYERQREALRAIATPEPPRDLWARTAAALDREAAMRRSSRRGAARTSPTVPRSLARTPIARVVPYGALAGVLVVAVVVGASFLARRTPPAVTASLEPSPAASLPLATPIAIPAGPIAWLEQRDDGTYALALASLGQVCPGPAGTDCAPITPPQEIALALSGEPRVVVRSPTSDRLVVVVGGESGGRVLVVPVPSPSPVPSPTVVVSPSPSSTPTPTASATPTPSPARTSASPASPTVSPEPTPAVSPSEEPEPSPTVSAAPTTSPGPSSTASAVPSASAAPASPTPSAPPLEPIAILEGVSVVGETAAWAASGRWFAFSARPASGSGGPDVYVWQLGEERARPVTTDGRSVFSGWLGDWIVGSRVEQRIDGGVPDLRLGTGRPFLLDPDTGVEAPLDVVDMWRPVVDPTGRWAVYWWGSLRLSEDGVTWLPDAGALVLGPWPGGLPPTAYLPETDGGPTSPTGGVEAPTASGEEALRSDPPPTPAGSPAVGGPIRGRAASASPSSAPETSPSPSANPSASGLLEGSPSAAPSLELPEGLTAIAVGPLRDWDVRWDPTGGRFAVWVADAVDPNVGRLSLFTIDPQTGALDPEGVSFRDEPSLAGFALGLGRLAWAVPPGQGGEPSHIRVFAWSGSDVGTAVGQPGPGTLPVIVVR